jgi:Na+/melibiose symporter-like transporter
MIDDMFSYYLLDHLIQSGLSGQSAGTILLISELFNVIVGPLSAIIMVRMQPHSCFLSSTQKMKLIPLIPFPNQFAFPFTSFGQHRAWILLTTIPLSLFFTSLWFVPPPSFFASNPTNQFIFHLTLLLLFNWFYGHTLCTYEAIMPLMHSDAHVLQYVNSSRLFLGALSGLGAVALVAALVGPIPDDKIRFPLVAGLIASVLVVGVVGWVAVVREDPDRSQENPEYEGPRKKKIMGDGAEDEGGDVHSQEKDGGLVVEEVEGDKEGGDVNHDDFDKMEVDSLDTFTIIDDSQKHSTTTRRPLDSVSPSIDIENQSTKSVPTASSSNSVGSWYNLSRLLFTSKPFLILITNHFLLWLIIIFIHSSLPSLSRSLLIDSDSESSFSSASSSTTESSLVIVANKSGVVISQILIAFFPTSIRPELAVKSSILLITITTFLFATAFRPFSSTTPFQFPHFWQFPSWSVFPISILNGMGVGGLFTCYEIMVPETILYAERHLTPKLKTLLFSGSKGKTPETSRTVQMQMDMNNKNDAETSLYPPPPSVYLTTATPTPTISSSLTASSSTIRASSPPTSPTPSNVSFPHHDKENFGYPSSQMNTETNLTTTNTTTTNINADSESNSDPDSDSDINEAEWENVIYSWVDSIRELSLAIAFMGSGLVLDSHSSNATSTSSSSVNDYGNKFANANELASGWIPLGLVVLTFMVHLYFPKIVLVK